MFPKLKLLRGRENLRSWMSQVIPSTQLLDQPPLRTSSTKVLLLSLPQDLLLGLLLYHYYTTTTIPYHCTLTTQVLSWLSIHLRLMYMVYYIIATIFYPISSIVPLLYFIYPLPKGIHKVRVEPPVWDPSNRALYGTLCGWLYGGLCMGPV